MKVLNNNDLCRCAGGFEQGVVGSALCSAVGGFLTSTIGIGVGIFPSTISPQVTAFTYGVAAGCALSQLIP